MDEHTPISQEQLRLEFLRNRDVDCPVCGYNLRNLSSPRCPECGETLELKIGASEPRRILLFTGLVGLAMGAGFSGLMLLYPLIQIMRGGSGPNWTTLVVVTGLGFVVQLPLLICWLYFWRRLARLSTPRQAMLALAAWMITLTNLVLFSLLIR